MSAYGLFLVVLLGLLLIVGVYLFLPVRRSRPESGAPTDRQYSGPVYRDDDRYWLGGVIYNNPDDPDPFVPKRYGFGWTVNFGHPVGKLFMLVVLLLVLLPVILVLLGVHLTPIGCHPSGCYPAR